VQYVKNGAVIYESQRIPQYPLVFLASFGTVGATIAEARIETNGRSVARNDYYDNRYPSDEFAVLDRNNDGVVSASGAPRQTFNRLDLNRDGRCPSASSLVAKAASALRADSEHSTSRAVRSVGPSGANSLSIDTPVDADWYVNAGDWVGVVPRGVQLSTNQMTCPGLADPRRAAGGERSASRSVGWSADRPNLQFRAVALGEQGGISAPANGVVSRVVTTSFATTPGSIT
jgi:hypothetical protein